MVKQLNVQETLSVLQGGEAFSLREGPLERAGLQLRLMDYAEALPQDQRILEMTVFFTAAPDRVRPGQCPAGHIQLITQVLTSGWLRRPHPMKIFHTWSLPKLLQSKASYIETLLQVFAQIQATLIRTYCPCLASSISEANFALNIFGI